ncbi:MAG: hypothetical protein ACOYB0_09645 [Polynucleobacter sp.]
MIPRRATAIVFLCFTIVVAFYNALLNQFQYIPFVIPFALAVLLKGKPAQMAESFGITCAAIYIVVFQLLHVGIMGMLVAAAMFYTLGVPRRTERIYLYSTTAILFFASLLRNNGYPIQPLRASLDAGIYAVCSFCIYVAIQNHIAEAKQEKPLSDKCIDTLEEAVKIANEAITIAKSGKQNG